MAAAFTHRVVAPSQIGHNKYTVKHPARPINIAPMNKVVIYVVPISRIMTHGAIEYRQKVVFGVINRVSRLRWGEASSY